MSLFLIDYLERQIAACDEMIAAAPDDRSLRIYRATRERYRRDIERLKREAATSA